MLKGSKLVLLVDAVAWVGGEDRYRPDASGLHLHRRARQHGRREDAFLAAVLEVLGDGGEGDAAGDRKSTDLVWLAGDAAPGGGDISYVVAVSVGAL
jgi:hypothetical protein